jgi:hypothetical protein
MKKAAPFSAGPPACDEGLRLRVDLGQVVVLAARSRPAGAARSGGRTRPSRRPRSAPRRARTTGRPCAPAAAPASRRAPRCRPPRPASLGQFASPLDAVRMAHQRLLLPLAQAARQVDDACSASMRSPSACSSCTPARRSRRRTPRPRRCRCASACATCTASVWPNSGVSSGAVTKSLPDDGMCAELARGVGVVAQAGRVQRERHEAVEADPAAGALDGPRAMSFAGRGRSLHCDASLSSPRHCLSPLFPA